MHIYILFMINTIGMAVTPLGDGTIQFPSPTVTNMSSYPTSEACVTAANKMLEADASVGSYFHMYVCMAYTHPGK